MTRVQLIEFALLCTAIYVIAGVLALAIEYLNGDKP